MVMFTAHTTEDGITTFHDTDEQAMVACVERADTGLWIKQVLPYGIAYTMGEERDLYAVVFPTEITHQIVDDFGLYID